jgi:hypothetical protein
MSGKTLQLRVDLLKLILNGTPLANVFDNAASSPIGSVYVGMHYQDPGAGAGFDQTLYELDYGSYGRVAVVRSTLGWTVSTSGSSVIAIPVADIVFPIPTTLGSSFSGLWASIGRAVSGAGYLFWSGSITSTIIPSLTLPPTLLASSTLTEA